MHCRCATFSRPMKGSAGLSVHFKKNMENNIDKYLIMCANCAHPSGEIKWFLLEDDDENTVEFETFNDALEWVNTNPSGLLAYTILATSDFLYR